MNCLEAFEKSKKIKRPSWRGYWELVNNTIIMHTKDREKMDIRDTKDVNYTLSNILANDWIVATNENTPILGGEINLSYKEASMYIMRGAKMKRNSWKYGEYVILDENKGLIFNDGISKPWIPNKEDKDANDWSFC